jgi:GNAT superfamily N-acetyltransferase
VTAFDPAAIIAAIEQTFVDHTCAFVRVGGGDIHEIPSLTWVESAVPLGAFNGVIRTALADVEVDTTITEISAHFQARRKPMYWWVGPSTRPVALARRLRTHGFTDAGCDIGMAADLHAIDEPPSLPGLVIERVHDDVRMRQWLHAFGEGFGLTDTLLATYSGFVTGAPPDSHPAGRFYLALLNGAPVGTAGLFCAAGVANVVQVCTVPSARRRGVGRAITHAALLHARTMGYRIAVLRASEAGAALYQRMGFARCGTLDAYRLAALPA